MDDRERLFFEHDVVTPLSNLRGADYLLRSGPGNPDPRAAEALDILSGNIRHLERMLGWYWRTHTLSGVLDAVEPWAASRLPAELASRIREEGISLPAPAAKGKLPGWAVVPPEPLTVGLLGAAVTLTSASGQHPEWTLGVVRGVLAASFRVSGDRLSLDPSRLFRKYYWPAPTPIEANLDAGFPYLEAVLEPFGGHLEMAWEDGVWTLLATLPLYGKKGAR